MSEEQEVAWEKNNWAAGDIITADKLNGVENKLEEVAASQLIPYSNHEKGLVPTFNIANASDGTYFLCADGTWKEPTKIGISSSNDKAFLIGTTTSASGNVEGVIKTAVFMTNGVLTATRFVGKGSSITELDASNLKTGTIELERLPSTITASYLPSANGTNAGIVHTVEGSGITINNGEISVTKPLPTVSNSDDGKFLRVSNGAWAAVEVQSAAGQSF